MTTFYKTKDDHVVIKINESFYFDLTVNDILTIKPEIVGQYKDSNCTIPVETGPTLSDAAKQYLTYIIAPFRDKVKYMTFYGGYVEITLDEDYLELPCYDKYPNGFIVINDKDDKHQYTIEELGL